MGLISQRGKEWSGGRNCWTLDSAGHLLMKSRVKSDRRVLRGRKNPLWSSGLRRSRQDGRTRGEFSSSAASQSSSSSFSSSVSVVGLAAIGGGKSSLVRLLMADAAEGGREAKEGVKEAVGWGGHRHSAPLSLPPLLSRQTRLGRCLDNLNLMPILAAYMQCSLAKLFMRKSQISK